MSEPVPDLLRDLCGRFEAIEGLWSPAQRGKRPKLLGANDIAPTAVLNRFLVPGIYGQIFFAGRFPKFIEQDVASSDDYVCFDIDSDQVDFVLLCNDVFPALTDAFGSYRAALETDAVVSAADFEKVRAQSKTKPDSDGRNGVIRLWPVCFMDDLLCRRSFDLSAEEVVEGLAPHCERAELRNNGALIIATTELLTGAAMDEVDARLRRALQG
ncbi:hypothetical protein NFI95_12270 [Acetobacteraceae bacterium KSS8]|uniref:Uncharacterized protein n=1 Tax=Endosaccharibacter trunci TaxID=2812733 RepID=A0ABT1W8K4_9PROT|nr:hypothetical protein [Acetobacteraceae bacterium KSS8]